VQVGRDGKIGQGQGAIYQVRMLVEAGIEHRGIAMK
jgi:hypothetical protein